jgi:hypothetical protein
MVGEIELARWQPHRTFVQSWHQRLGPGDGLDRTAVEDVERRLQIPIPDPLAEWYRIAGRRRDLVEGHDILMRPEALAMSDDALVFMQEHSGSGEWGIARERLKEPDPLVSVRDDGDWVLETNPLTMFLLQMLVYTTVAKSPTLTCAFEVDSDDVSSSLATWDDVQLLGRPWVFGSTRFHLAPDALIVVSAELLDEGSSQVYAAARSARALASVTERIPGRWSGP